MHFRKAFETYCYLKYFHENGAIWNFSNRVQELADNCNICKRTFWTRYKWMKEYKLASIQQGHLKLKSWEDLKSEHGLETIEFYYIKLKDYDNKKRLEYLIETMSGYEKQKQMENACLRKYNRHVDMRYEINANVGVMNSPEMAIKELMNLQLRNFIIDKNCNKDNYLNLLNPDFNINNGSIAFLINGRKSRASGTYSKRKWVKYNLAVVTKRMMVESLMRARWCRLGTTFYSRPTKKTFLNLPDDIRYFPSTAKL